MTGVPAREVDIDEQLVRRLLVTAAPALAALPCHLAFHGWDNDIWRLGDRLAVRLPRRAMAATLAAHEQRSLDRLAPLLPLAVPAPVVTGEPVDGVFPWPWSVVPWYDGDLAATHPPEPSQAAVLGAFLARLHSLAPDGLADNPFRSGPLAQYSEPMAARLAALRGDPSLDDAGSALIDHAERVWLAGRAAAPAPQRAWVHGDLHPRNVLTRDGRLHAVLDWGDTTAGDPAVDLSAVWWLFDVAAHAPAFAAYGEPDDHLWLRSRAWAAYFGLMWLGFRLASDPARLDVEGARLGRALLERVAATPAPPWAQ